MPQTTSNPAFAAGAKTALPAAAGPAAASPVAAAPPSLCYLRAGLAFKLGIYYGDFVTDVLLAVKLDAEGHVELAAGVVTVRTRAELAGWRAGPAAAVLRPGAGSPAAAAAAAIYSSCL